LAEDDVNIGWGDTASPPQQATIGRRYESGESAPSAAANQAPGLAGPTPPPASGPGAWGNTPVANSAAMSQPPTASQAPPLPHAGTPGFDPFDRKDVFASNLPTPNNGGTAQQGNTAPTGSVSTSEPTPPAAASAAPNAAPQTVDIAATRMATTAGIAAAPTATQPSTNTEQPWMPLLLVSLSLAGSIGANLFLGWSYVDARQKYRTLVQKTANKFRRATSAE
jgi:hypothetical protein